MAGSWPYNAAGGYPGMMDSNWGNYGGPGSVVPPGATSPPVTPNNPQGGPFVPGAMPNAPGGAMNAPMGGTPYTPGMGAVGPGGQTSADQFNPLSDTKASIYRALLHQGLNPDAPTWGINQLLKRADDIVRQLAGRLAQGGNENVLTGGGFQDAVNALIGGGGPTLSSRAEAKSALESVKNMVGQSISGGGSEGAQFLASILGPDPAAAAGFMDSLLYGGLAPDVRKALQRPLAFMPDRFAAFTEMPGGDTYARAHSALDILMSGLLGSGAQGPTVPQGPAGAASPYGYQGQPPRSLVPGQAGGY